ncbi:MAG: class III poly(R)-hydroxyalkanoic acid synthase subunit PhaC [SAR324 cluster bacterium]|nr:class III poly(R)-hydroxyalkanoic acid synthase subunit PhaC [SAR324 cluster bacterium]
MATKPSISLDHILSKLAEDSQKAQTLLDKGSNVLLEPLETGIAPTPYEVVYQEDRVSLKYYKPTVPIRSEKPLLIVYALINRETMLDLQPGRSVVQKLLSEGIELYMVDWGYPTRMDQYLTIDDHVNGYMDNMVDFIRDKHNIPSVNLMGICMGGAFSVMYAAIHPEKINALVTTVTPTNFDTEQGLLHVWMKHLDVNKLVDANGNLSGDSMNFAFLLLNPARLMIDKYVGFLEHMDNKEFVENFIRMEKWIFDSPDIPGETLRQFVTDCYQKNLLIQNEMVLGDHKVDLRKITMPVLNFYGKYDHLVPPEACEKLTSAVGSKDTEDICLDTGHIGIYVSSKCQKLFAPKIVEWLLERQPKSRPEIKTTPKAPEKKAKKSEKSDAPKKTKVNSRKRE